MHEKSLALAKQCSHCSREEEGLLDALCLAAEADLAGRLREGTAPADCGELFTCAAALTATGELLIFRQENGGVQQFTAGDISVRLGDGGSEDAALPLRRQAARLLAPYLRDGDFAFMEVAG